MKILPSNWGCGTSIAGLSDQINKEANANVEAEF